MNVLDEFYDADEILRDIDTAVDLSEDEEEIQELSFENPIDVTGDLEDLVEEID